MLELGKGWGMASARVRPYDSDTIEVYSDMVAGLIIAKDNNGAVYMPDLVLMV